MRICMQLFQEAMAYIFYELKHISSTDSFDERKYNVESWIMNISDNKLDNKPVLVRKSRNDQKLQKGLSVQKYVQTYSSS